MEFIEGKTSVVFDFRVSWAKDGDYVSLQDDTCVKVVTLTAYDDYNESEISCLLDRDNVNDIIEFLSNKQEKRSPSPFVTNDDIISSYGINKKRSCFSITNYNKMYQMFSIEGIGGKIYFEKYHNDMDKFPIGKTFRIDCDNDERYGFKESIFLSEKEKQELLENLINLGL